MSEASKNLKAKSTEPDPPTTPPTKLGKGIFPEGFALLVGVGHCEYEPWSLPVTSKDAEALQAVLADPERCGYLEENIQILTDEDATRDEILKGLETLDRRAARQPNSTVVVFYSGHGWVDEEGHYYLVPSDTKPFDLSATALRAEDFTKALSKIRPERLLVILDTCHAAGMAEAKNAIPPGFRRKAPPEEIAEILGNGQGRAVLSSCRGEQSSWILPSNRLSVFTHHLIEALGGQGSPAKAEFVSVLDLMSYVSREVEKTANTLSKAQTPFHKLEAENFPVAVLQPAEGPEVEIPSDIARKEPQGPSQTRTKAGRDNNTAGRDNHANSTETSSTTTNYAGRDIVAPNSTIHGSLEIRNR